MIMSLCSDRDIFLRLSNLLSNTFTFVETPIGSTNNFSRFLIIFYIVEKLVKGAKYQFSVRAVKTTGEEGSAVTNVYVYKGVENCQLLIQDYTVLDEVRTKRSIYTYFTFDASEMIGL